MARLAALLFAFLAALSVAQRPPPFQRRFVSVAVDKFIANLTSRLRDPVVASMFERCFPNPLDTTVEVAGAGDTFVVTGDIPAMWLRDATNQVLNYMPFATQDAALDSMLQGLITRQTRCVLLDPWANAFQKDEAQLSPNEKDQTTKPSFLGTTVNAQSRLIFERKFEIDSLAAYLKLGNAYYEATGNTAPFDATWVRAVSLVVAVLQSRQNPSPSDYTFLRQTTTPTDTLVKGVGQRMRKTGLLASPFRPSDDATTLPFLVPANAMVAVELNRTARLLVALGQPDLAAQAQQLSHEIELAVFQWAVVQRGDGLGPVLAYEVDGFGNALFMDDANSPSLLSLPLLGFMSASDPLYVKTRSLILSEQTNPFFFAGDSFKGIGSPHTDAGSVWPMSLIVQALTSTDLDEIKGLLQQLTSSTAGTGFMHESFSVDDPTNFSRPWFAWANALFGQLVIDLVRRFPAYMLK